MIRQGGDPVHLLLFLPLAPHTQATPKSSRLVCGPVRALPSLSHALPGALHPLSRGQHDGVTQGSLHPPDMEAEPVQGMPGRCDCPGRPEPGTTAL